MNTIIDYKPKQRRRKPKTTLRHETNQVIRSLMITLGIMIAILTVAFFRVNNGIAQKGYSLQQAQLMNSDLLNKKESLHAKITDVITIKNLETETSESSMQQPENLDYITKEDNKI